MKCSIFHTVCCLLTATGVNTVPHTRLHTVSYTRLHTVRHTRLHENSTRVSSIAFIMKVLDRSF